MNINARYASLSIRNCYYEDYQFVVVAETSTYDCDTLELRMYIDDYLYETRTIGVTGTEQEFRIDLEDPSDGYKYYEDGVHYVKIEMVNVKEEVASETVPMVTGKIPNVRKVKFGTLYLDNSPVRPPADRERGIKFSGYSTVAIGDTDPDTNKQIQWVPVKYKGKNLLVCDRVLLTYISAEYLNDNYLLTGTRVVIDGKNYILRVLSTGSGFVTADKDFSSEGYYADSNNEWDDIICNKSNIRGLISPYEFDLRRQENEGENYLHKYSPHAKVWNWDICDNYGPEMSKLDDTKIICRGGSAANYMKHTYYSSFSNYTGWRPVLEEVDTQINPIVLKDGLGNEIYPVTSADLVDINVASLSSSSLNNALEEIMSMQKVNTSISKGEW